MSVYSKYKYTFFTFVLGLLYYFFSRVYDYDLVERAYEIVRDLEHLEFDELLVSAFITIQGFIADLIRHLVRIKVESEHYNATLAIVQNIQEICNDLSQPLMALLNQCEMSTLLIEQEETETLDKKKVGERLQKILTHAIRIDKEISHIRKSIHEFSEPDNNNVKSEIINKFKTGAEYK